MLLSENCLQLFNAQYSKEISNSLAYQARRAYAASCGLENIAAFFAKQAQGEIEHAEKVLQFILDRDGDFNIAGYSITQDEEFGSMDALFTSALELEQETTGMLSDIYNAAFGGGDFQTCAWLSCGLITEQIEEEKIFFTITDRLEGYAAAPGRESEIDEWIKEEFSDDN